MRFSYIYVSINEEMVPNAQTRGGGKALPYFCDTLVQPVEYKTFDFLMLKMLSFIEPGILKGSVVGYFDHTLNLFVDNNDFTQLFVQMKSVFVSHQTFNFFVKCLTITVRC